MLKLLTCISKGKASLKPEGLRCGAARKKEPERKCDKLLVKRSARGQIAGNFRCDRCGQEIDVSMIEPQPETAAYEDAREAPRPISPA